MIGEHCTILHALSHSIIIVIIFSRNSLGTDKRGLLHPGCMSSKEEIRMHVDLQEMACWVQNPLMFLAPKQAKLALHTWKF